MFRLVNVIHEISVSRGQSHARDFIFSYYSADNDVLQDHEVQGLANEVSSEGLGSNGGQGKVLYIPMHIF